MTDGDRAGISTRSSGAVDLQRHLGVNNNVLLFIPPGYSTNIGAGCYDVNSSQIHCTETTGPITAQ